MTGTLNGDQYTFFIIFRSVLPSMRNISDRRCRENPNTHYMFNNFFSRNRDVYRMEKYYRAGNATDDNIIQRMLSARWITKA
jgi:hypothetical protein